MHVLQPKRRHETDYKGTSNWILLTKLVWNNVVEKKKERELPAEKQESAEQGELETGWLVEHVLRQKKKIKELKSTVPKFCNLASV